MSQGLGISALVYSLMFKVSMFVNQLTSVPLQPSKPGIPATPVGPWMPGIPLIPGKPGILKFKIIFVFFKCTSCTLQGLFLKTGLYQRKEKGVMRQLPRAHLQRRQTLSFESANIYS